MVLLVPDPIIRLEPDGRRVVVARYGIQRTVIATVWPGPYVAALLKREARR